MPGQIVQENGNNIKHTAAVYAGAFFVHFMLSNALYKRHRRRLLRVPLRLFRTIFTGRSKMITLKCLTKRTLFFLLYRHSPCPFAGKKKNKNWAKNINTYISFF